MTKKELRFVIDATPLIHLTRAGLISLLVDLEGKKYAVPAVVDEVVGRGEELGYPDAGGLESLLEQAALSVKAPQKTKVDAIVRLHRDIHAGESEVIVLAKEMGAIAIIDDRVARAVAKIHGIRLEGSYGVILRAVARGSMSKDEAEEALGALVTSGWRCDAELYAALLASLRRLAARQTKKE